MSQSKSPAVEAYELDKARKQQQEKDGDLDKALEDTFPASDPVSHSVTSVAGAPAASEKADSENLLDAIRAWVKDNPIAAVAVTAAVAWVIGSRR
ncbi:ElaB/YqjD/DUF883 family membrane-anchored ribosome-binding protein [Rhizobium sp. BK196]|uniref:hypothetical protein n=1 Tax=unclassified Rhizobium TaxID=2613769 RepID=UPI0016182119|nr:MULTISPECIES: hypothetical protein [unclassified Rhizobium]MBB3313380.1 ElaB/YqjD/DUF883 family membrane-anchored ribosome-binding protein [Rhizobium sp. BK196]MBB3464498.1 ElaB/YqjD/DUF883 family membrane-anchored ribosome-binding protein [Rhizobium sp. BK377]